ncbi:DUF4145 domain-containing protein [Piscirickettsia salmonis]|uniref:DUF4145 domain-containing protein n=1 Tax=Piscirickettsia salmonis TaxID=1238 RepID=UPI0007C8AB24|nr:hypothetical protein A0O36_00384 [Piscirickettsiaceae bacterium NZ-RLO1]
MEKITKEGFICPYCDTKAQMTVHILKDIKTKDEINTIFIDNSRIVVYTCYVCGNSNIALQHLQNNSLIKEQTIYPKNIDQGIDKPNACLPEKCNILYLEAASILNNSPRSSAALLRQALEEICKILGATKGNLVDKIEKIVKDNNLTHIHELMSIVRVIGNTGAHATAEINFNDTENSKEFVIPLFKLLNAIAKQTFEEEKDIKEFKESLPKNLLKKIKNASK